MQKTSPSQNDHLSPIRSSVPYQIFLYFNFWYIILFIVVEIGVFIWKGIILPYPEGTFSSEIILAIILVVLACLAVYTGYYGNRFEILNFVIGSFLISVPLIGGLLYLLLWQTYVLWLEVITISFELFFIFIEILYSVICAITFSRAKLKTL